jgi:hypothetical protein
MYRLMMSAREFSSDKPDEDMMTLKLRTTPNRNSSKQKHGENTIYKPWVIRGVIKAKIKHRNKITGGNRDGNELQVVSPQGGAAWSGTVPPGGEESPDSVSCPFLSRDFSYLIKTTKILMEKFNANHF